LEDEVRNVKEAKIENRTFTEVALAMFRHSKYLKLLTWFVLNFDFNDYDFTRYAWNCIQMCEHFTGNDIFVLFCFLIFFWLLFEYIPQ